MMNTEYLLNDEELKNVTGGMKIVVAKSSKFLAPILRLIFKIKKATTE
jgi:bacteriocin-like protein